MLILFCFFPIKKMKKKIALLTGGNSSEYPISLMSANEMAKQIDSQKYELYVITIRGNDWLVTSGLQCDTTIDRNDFSFTFDNQKTTFDLIIFAIHGTPAEDGKLQAYFDMLGIKYIGCDMLTSALTFDKYTCNSYLRNRNIKMAKSILIKDLAQVNIENLEKELGLPMFVKPNNGGSSYGASKVKHIDELIPAIEKAFKEDKAVLVEEFIKGVEITCGVVKTTKAEIVLPLTEIVYEAEFFDTQTKYTDNLAQEITPARISEELTLECQKISSDIYDLLNCKGLVRVDYFLSNNQFYFLELNTIPGMTANSLVPKQIRASNYTFKQIFDLMIDDVLNQ